MAWLRDLLEVAVVVGSVSVPRGLAWIVALFGSDKYSERAMRLLRRPPLQGTKNP